MNSIPPRASDRSRAQQQYNIARANLIAMIGLTLFNIILLALGSDRMMLFSAFAPYVAVMTGITYGYTPVLIICIAVAAVMLIAYFLCWLFSKKHFGWMIAALVLFSLDTAYLLAMCILAQDLTGILNLALHALVLFYLIVGVKYGAQLRKIPEEPAENAVRADIAAAQIQSNTQPLYRADEEAKARVLAEADAFGRHICYRKLSHNTKELVISGYVYDKLQMTIETAHELTAVVDGHLIQAGYDGLAHSYIKADGQEIAKKVRLV